MKHNKSIILSGMIVVTATVTTIAINVTTAVLGH